MEPFTFSRATDADQAIRAAARSSTAQQGAEVRFVAGGTTLVDLMKLEVERPTQVVDINQLPLAKVERSSDGGLKIGALVRNSDLARHPLVERDYAVLSQALLAGASGQLRNMATTGGNLLQRTRCYYFMDTAFPACNKRNPGSGCAALKGFNRIHAILGASAGGSSDSAECIATNPSDMNVALAALGATVHVQGPKGKRAIAFADFHRLPGKTPQIDTNLKPDELITSVELPAPRFAKNSWYLKVRDRHSYAFALVSVAAGLEMNGNTIKSAGLALGGIAHKPWSSLEAEKSLSGATPGPEAFKKAADLAVAGAKPYEHNAFKIELAKQSIVRALTLAAQGPQSPEGAQA
jgi:xanthine dehydrogenase YagS FAD-binding subunit